VEYDDPLHQSLERLELSRKLWRATAIFLMAAIAVELLVLLFVVVL
jgi:hypothetical protein